ncbi:MAG: winged helix-turn-helix domain-containing protein [Steroidobacteraceae bacterium]
MAILIIEDDMQAAQLMRQALSQCGYVVEHAADGEVGLRLALEQPWDLLIADRMLPKLEGLSIVKQVRESGSQVPILILSALSEVDDRVRGLRAGGDDYLTKPYAFAELLARVEGLLRRGKQTDASTRLTYADVEVDLLARKAQRADTELQLTAREFDLLVFLLRHANQVVTRKMLLEQVWDLHFDPQTNVIDVHMSRLRQAVDKNFTHALIHTVRGAGYVFGEPLE